MSGRLPKHKALKLLERAQGHLAREEYPQAEALLRQVVDSSPPLELARSFLGDALAGQGREDEAMALWQQSLHHFPHNPELCARIGASLSRQGRCAEAVEYLERAEATRRKDSGALLHLGFCLAQLGQLPEAERAAGRALQLGAGAQAKLVLALLRGQQGRYQDAQRLCEEAEAAARAPEVVDAARAVRADARLFLGDPGGALALWKELRAGGRLEPVHLAHMAYAAQLAGELELCDELVADRTASGPTAEDLLLFAQVSNLRGRPQQALAELAASEKVEGARHPGHDFELCATRGRALRLLGQREQARAQLVRLSAAPEAKSRRLGPKVQVDLGHLAAEEGDFAAAEEYFGAALKLDPDEPEARHGLELTSRKVAWREEVAASADARVEAAVAEAEALRRRFSAREGELEALRSELARLKAEQQAAVEQARRAQEEAQAVVVRAEAEQKRKLREELSARELEAEEKAKANLELALGPALQTCPRAVLEAFWVAEKTFQKALYTDLPAAAVAVLYTGALERALYTFFVERFRVWLREKGRLAHFLQGAVRERRGTRVEYFDHFVEAFDEERPGRAPSMGEVGRVVERRREPYLAPFRDFLAEHWREDEAFFDALAVFVRWSKETLRDPVAHGRGETVGYEQLRRFREQILFGLDQAPKGALAQLVSPR